MKQPHPVHVFILILTAVAACATALQAAPPTKVTVTATDPESALQGVSLPVEISGDGFDSGSQVRFLVTGSQDDDEIVVESVELVAPGKLRAHVHVRDDALVVDYDVEVRNSSGRRGKGTGLFRVESSTDTNTGGFGELGNGCVAFEPAASPGTFHDDGGGAYCNGTDGQVSVPKRLRLDTKKFNSNNRKYYLDAVCAARSPACNGTVDVEVLQSQLRHEWIDGQLVGTDELDFQGMMAGEITRVSVDLVIDRNSRLLFGNDSGDRMRCPVPSAAAPLWVQCLDDQNGDGFCDLWTLTTANLDGSAEPDARACLKNSKTGALLDGEVTADFSMAVCVLGVSCP